MDGKNGLPAGGHVEMIRLFCGIFLVTACAVRVGNPSQANPTFCVRRDGQPDLCFDTAADRDKVLALVRESFEAKDRAAEAERLRDFDGKKAAVAAQQCADEQARQAHELAGFEAERRAAIDKRNADSAQAFREEAAKHPDPPALKCCDGSESDSCVCGGPRRGCCSHHGGVCGCTKQ